MNNSFTLNLPISIGNVHKLQGVITRDPNNIGQVFRFGNKEFKSVRVLALKATLFTSTGRVLLETNEHSYIVVKNHDKYLKLLGYETRAEFIAYVFKGCDFVGSKAVKSLHLSLFQLDFKFYS